MEFIQNEAKSSRQGFKNKAVAKKYAEGIHCSFQTRR